MKWISWCFNFGVFLLDKQLVNQLLVAATVGIMISENTYGLIFTSSYNECDGTINSSTQSWYVKPPDKNHAHIANFFVLLQQNVSAF